MSPTLDLLKQLIACPSVTPFDAGCQDMISDRLKKAGFSVEFMHFGEVTNLWARHGSGNPLFVFAGHTDVVPPGPLTAWDSDPFTPVEREGYLYGRGAADMKSGLAAMIVAAENFVRNNPVCPGSIAFLITSDEEGKSIDGTKKVIQELTGRGEIIDYCIVGEANSNHLLGDQIRVGRRGSLHGQLTVFGKQGHVAYPEIAKNPIHLVAPALQELTTTEWDKGNDFFPPTTFQISNIHAGTGATNVVPGTLELLFNFRFGTAVTVDELQKRVTAILEKNALDFKLEWEHSGDPFLTKQGKLIEATRTTLKTLTGLDPALSTGGGTSDGRFIAKTGAEVIEVGPCNASIHQVNEHVRVADLAILTDIYYGILGNVFFG
ncbi:MAG TPA: succinyl-diaminopimelate desuccinylase [Gammaproteobacteria bacterium]|nr:succinyl-diaminopimelate desuccinylase [Gammaproteobacteria bacterium]